MYGAQSIWGLGCKAHRISGALDVVFGGVGGPVCGVRCKERGIYGA